MRHPMQQWMPIYEQQESSNFEEVTMNSCIFQTSTPSPFLSLDELLTPQEIANSSYIHDPFLSSRIQFKSSPPMEGIVSSDDALEHGLEFGCLSAPIKRKVKRKGGSKRKLDDMAYEASKQTHVLSEKRRRERIRERMKLLHQLLPDCPKPGAAEVLEEAINQIKALRVHIQIMSISGGIPVQQHQHYHISNSLSEAAIRKSMHVPPPFLSPYGSFPLPSGSGHLMNPTGVQIPLISGTIQADPRLQMQCTTCNNTSSTISHMFDF